MRSAVLVGCSLLFLASSAIAAGSQEVVEGKKVPAWATSGDGPGAFLGVAEGSATEAEAVDAATANAAARVLASLGVQVRSSLRIQEQVTTVGGKDDYRAQAEREVAQAANGFLKVKPVQRHVQRWVEHGPSGDRTFWKAWILVRFSEEEHQLMMLDVVELVERQVRAAKESGDALWATGDVDGAFKRYAEVVRADETLKQVTSLPSELRLRLEAAVRGLRDHVRDRYQRLRVTVFAPKPEVSRGALLANGLVLSVTLENGSPARATCLVLAPDGGAELEARPVTDAAGEATIRLHKVDRKNPTLRLRVAVDLGERLAATLPRAPVEVTVRLAPTNLALRVEGGAAGSQLAKRIGQEVTAALLRRGGIQLQRCFRLPQTATIR